MPEHAGEGVVIFPSDWRRSLLPLSEGTPIHAGIVASPEATIADWDMHYGVEVGIVLSGRMRRFWRTWATELGAGEVWLCGIWERHGWEVVEGPCEHLVFVILPEVLVAPGLPAADCCDWLAPFRAPPDQRPQARASMRHEMLALSLQVIRRLGPETHRRGVWIRLLIIQMLLLLQREWEQPLESPSPLADSFQALAGAVELVFATPRAVSTTEAAAACAMSNTAFSRRFRNLMGITFAKFALRHRLSQAAAQLLRTEHPLKAVAVEWGFTDDSHLHRAFLHHYGCSPGEYRRRRSSGSGPSVGAVRGGGQPRRSR